MVHTMATKEDEKDVKNGEAVVEEALEKIIAVEPKASEEVVVEEVIQRRPESLESWTPRTALGRDVVAGKHTSLNDILDMGLKIMEPQIVDYLMPEVLHEIIFIGGSPGKGGGIKRTITRKTARMHKSGRRFRISAMVVIGNGDGLVGVGKGTGKEHRLAIEKALEHAKLNMIAVKRGCGSWECGCGASHSIIGRVTGKSGSVKMTLMPAPKGVGLVVDGETKKLLRIVGLKDVWSRTSGNTAARYNLIMAGFNALRNMGKMRTQKAGE